MAFSVDIEPTNRCNAKCHFCPRDQTPHEGLMQPDVFVKSLERAIEYRAMAHDLRGEETELGLCGLGEPLLNRHTPDFARQAVDAGFIVTLSTNGSLLDERRGAALLDAGVQKLFINVGDEGQEYEDVYRLPFERTRDNVLRFAEMSNDRCKVYMVLVDHRRDAEHLRKMQEYWRGHGINRFMQFDIINRGGALFVDHMQFESYAELEEARARLRERAGAPVCGAPFAYLFIGYDGQYYLCCSDWRKETPMGSVFDESFLSVMDRKLQYVTSRDPVCKTCNLDPLNRVTEELRAVAEGSAMPESADEVIESVIASNNAVHEIAASFGVDVPEASEIGAGQIAPVRRRIPLTVE
jgi:MoaA/NifB/PqqE/SkfB family radical SAM enzyme